MKSDLNAQKEDSEGRNVILLRDICFVGRGLEL
jgi:hypothetical protein